jgi:predicted regulator of Ras-like GTPase activity (Roadblock/LC7/MglB family)
VAVQSPQTAQTLGELFGQPQKQNWSPNELVQRTAALPGISGALVALQDGFLVAASLPPGWKAETISAFLPQIFGRMNAYCREIGLSDTKSVIFSIAEGTFQIFKTGIIYLAILSRPGGAIHEHAVGLIASELNRHTK